MNTVTRTNGKGWRAVCLTLFALLIFLFPAVFVRQTETAKAASGGSATVHSYVVNARVEQDGRVYIEETLDMTVHIYANMFYRSLPMEGDRFFNIQASCDGNEDFSVTVEDNPDVDGFMDICCHGGVEPGNRWTYRFSYVMQVSGLTGDGMIVDFVGGGWPFALNNVTVNVTFPAELTGYTIHSNRYGESGNEYVEVKNETDTSLSLFAETLPVYYEGVYGDYVATPITLDFQLAAGGLSGYAAARVFSDGLWLAILIGLVLSALFAVAFFKFRKPREIVTVVNVKPPQGMDPLRMGKFIDGTVDNEDITSMIYYFATEGYLKIRMDGEEPVLIRTKKVMPDFAPVYHRTLLNGLFKDGDEVAICDLQNEYYVSVDKAQMQLSVKDIPMYENKSLIGVLVGGILSTLIFTLLPLLMGVFYVGQGYAYFGGLFMALPVGAVVLGGVLLENRKYKWKKSVQTTVRIILAIICALGALAYLFLIGTHLTTESEKIVTCLFGYAVAWLAPCILTRTERYVETLGQVLGFKEFIEVTEDEERIKFMLEENPELFYDILPYAQVLGVTDEWEKKFEGILLKEPSWYAGDDYTLFDYYVFSRSMRMASVAMTSRPQSNSVGGAGGGGSFGGFSGGGHGGGGGGFR